MSRALDPDTFQSLQRDNFQTVYTDIVSALSTDSEELLEIEFLGKSHALPLDCNVLIDGNNIAVMKVKLVQAFMVARQIFTHLRSYPTEKEHELRNATSVILLLDPEHLTAANTRKRLIRKCQNGSSAELQANLKKELRFVDGYLTSRLHRHTKSPTLWGHRRWVIEQCMEAGIEQDIEQDLKSVVMVAAERHPRNYYAWSHMRWLVQLYGPNTYGDISKTISIVKDWCLRHPSDISGFSFLLFSLFNLGPADFSTLARTEICSSVCADVLRLTLSFKWTHESVWVFLRTLLASNFATETVRTIFLQAIEVISAARPDGQHVLKAAVEWYQRNQQILQT